MKTPKVQELALRVWDAAAAGERAPYYLDLQREMYLAIAEDLTTTGRVYDPSMDVRVTWLRETVELLRTARPGAWPQRNWELRAVVAYLLDREEAVERCGKDYAAGIGMDD